MSSTRLLPGCRRCCCCSSSSFNRPNSTTTTTNAVVSAFFHGSRRRLQRWSPTVATTRLGSTLSSNNRDNDNHHHNHNRDDTKDRSVSIGNVHISHPPAGSGRPDLIPNYTDDASQLPQLSPLDHHNHHFHNSHHPHPQQLGHWRWMLQKDLALRQDFLLTGPAATARDRRQTLLTYAALVGREVEYVALSRDTSNADLKQRQEVRTTRTTTGGNGRTDTNHNNDNKATTNPPTTTTTTTTTTVYADQAPVRAARHGRLLILDGLEKAERNVLPTLNNLLENRELALDDGSLLVAPHVYEQYIPKQLQQQQGGDQGFPNDATTTTTTTTPANSTTTTVQIRPVHPDFRVAALASWPAHLDPPLRSRFQARLTSAVPAGELWQMLAADSSHNNSSLSTTGSLDLERLKQLCQLVATMPTEEEELSAEAVRDAVRYWERSPGLTSRAVLLPWSGEMMSVDKYVSEMTNDSRREKDNKSQLQEQQQQQQQSTTATFIETPTTRAVQHLIQTAFDSGSRAVALVGPKGCYKSALARHYFLQDHPQQHSPSKQDDNGTAQPSTTNNNTSMTPLLFSLNSDLTARDLLLSRGTDGHGNTDWRTTPLTKAIINGRAVILDGIDKLSSDTLSSLSILWEHGFLDLPNGQRVQAQTGFQCIGLAHLPNDETNDWRTPEIRSAWHSIRVEPLPDDELKQVLMGLYPNIDVRAVEKVVWLRNRLESANSSGAADTVEEQESLTLSLRKMKHICMRLAQQKDDNLPRLVHNALLTSLMPDREEKIVQRCMRDGGIVPANKTKKKRKHATRQSSENFENLLESCRRTPEHPLLVPDPVFEENPGHGQVLQDILEAHVAGERALLVMGFQGVGKNRICDHLLHRLQCEREYVQLHRDTTIQSFLSTPSVENGRIVYGDSPLVRAAKHGRILVVDEADKAPVEVVALLKGLIEDGELALPNGRVLRYRDGDGGDDDDDDVLPIHPDFRIWALANPAGYPFHGNDLAREISDIFSCHIVPPLDALSQERILKRYGPNVPDMMIQSLVRIWQDLREAHEKGVMAYPFSVREAVSVVRHLNEFPSDGIEGAVENVIAFDRLDTVVLKQLAKVFAHHGVPVSTKSDRTPREAIEGGISTPRTRASKPKHGKIDEKNDPHVGGNTWAGGSGGSDTAGLGGRGGPYRLDSGHPVHQVSEQMKAEVSEAAQREAKAMAKAALQKKLKELNMGKLDWERYESIHSHVELQIQQLQVMLKDIRRRKEERIWLKRQSTGEIDDSRLVDALAGEKDVFKRRGKPSENNNNNNSQTMEPIVIKVLVDISASMYRFNGFDGRLQRSLEATLMLMEALKEDKRFQLNIIGHSGDSADIPLVNGETPHDPKTQLRVLETMVAHAQYCFSGDSTLEAIQLAVSQAHEGDLILVISDANLERYHIDPEEVSSLMHAKKGVHTHLVLIGGFGEEPLNLARSIPNERAQVCLDSSELPLIIKNIIASAAK